jgi:hypothetical protein
MQGRVFTLLISSMSIAAPLALALSGPLVDAFGIRTLFLISGTGCLCLALAWALNPTIMHLEDHVRKA